jgi:pyruvate/2-oxoglutarate dehydrogenase complex dihydrolipoamide acyltransferase (E2) component
MAHEVKLPPLGDDAPDEAEISFWYVEEGEQIEEGQDLVEMVTDKAAFTVPSPVGGTLSQKRAEEGDTVAVGQVMAIVEE